MKRNVRFSLTSKQVVEHAHLLTLAQSKTFAVKLSDDIPAPFRCGSSTKPSQEWKSCIKVLLSGLMDACVGDLANSLFNAFDKFCETMGRIIDEPQNDQTSRVVDKRDVSTQIGEVGISAPLAPEENKATAVNEQLYAEKLPLLVSHKFVPGKIKIGDRKYESTVHSVCTSNSFLLFSDDVTGRVVRIDRTCDRSDFQNQRLHSPCIKLALCTYSTTIG
jgi:hypothetical protein